LPPSFVAVLDRYPELKAGLPDHVDELLRIAQRIVAMETTPDVIPNLPAAATAWEKAYWARRAERRPA
jgi:hypothetical protein